MGLLLKSRRGEAEKNLLLSIIDLHLWWKKQAGAELGQAQIKPELELGFSSIKIWIVKLG